jgi:hypothetical protein
MLPAKGTTRFDSLNQKGAIAIGIAFAVALTACLITSLEKTPPEPTITGPTFSDAQVLYKIVARVHGGQNYYDAAGIELRYYGYPTRSIFNWRQPFYAWFLGALPNATTGRVILGALTSIAIVWGTWLAYRRADDLAAVLCFWLMFGACWPCFLQDGPTNLENSTGVLIVLSFFSYADEQIALAVACAILALIIRELAAPYVLVCVALALTARRWRELIGWAVGLLLYAAYFAYHALHALAAMRPDDLRAKSWIQFGGLHFILGTASQHSLLYNLPLWVTAIYLPLAVLGVAAIPGRLGQRAIFTIVAYLMLFSSVGKSFNEYWGYVDGPLLAFGLAWTPLAFYRLALAFRSPSGQPTPIATP